MEHIKIISILVKDRIKEAGRTQKTLSKHACLIKNRLGTHEVSESTCSRVGLIILQLTGDNDKWPKLEQDLAEIGGIEVKSVEFDY